MKAFYVGLAAMQTGEDARAEENLTRVTQIVPREPAAWANLGLLALRQREFERAAERLEKARALAPDSSPLYVLLGLLESTRGKYAEAISYLRRAVELDPKDLKAIYALAQEVERQAEDNSDKEAQHLLERILAARPGNLAVQLELIRVAAKRGDTDALQQTITRMTEHAASWPAEVREQFSALQAAASGPNPRLAATRVAFLKNVLVRDPDYRQSLAEVKCPPEIIGEPIERLIAMPSPDPAPAPADEALAFDAAPMPGVDPSQWPWVGAVWLDGDRAPSLVLANASEARILDGATLAFPGGASKTPPAPAGIIGLDFNYDFRTDLFLAGAGGFRLLQQDNPATFTDVTARMSLPAAITGGAYRSAWAADIDSEGDLDIVLAPLDGKPLVLRNNGDGGFQEIRPFDQVSSLRGFIWADLDKDGDPDAALLDGDGRLQVFTNDRSGQFRLLSPPQPPGKVAAINVADANGDGAMDLIALVSGGSLLRISARAERDGWDTEQIGSRAPGPPNGIGEASFSLFAADFDNNGGIDFLESGPSGSQLWLGNEEGKFQPLTSSIGAEVISVADLSGDGRLDLLGRSLEGRAVRLENRGAKNYHWQVVRPRAATSEGDQRINSFGIGGEMEIRSGLLFQKQAIRGPAVHFGLGDHTEADLVRIIWPNGTVQAEYDLDSDQAVAAEQRLKGSCPWVFTYDGRQMSFVTDFIWRSPLGLRINAQDTANVMMTEDWVKIRGDQLVASDGIYDVRITTELWETQFFDHISLMVVDHPPATEVFVDERFAVPPPALAVNLTVPPRPVVSARDDQGRDVTELIRERDGRYLDTFGRGPYQGVTRDHYVELELDEASDASQLLLLAHGWIHPTDSSINVALSQGRHAPPQGLSLEVPDGEGGWQVAKAGLGFPAGKAKTIVISLDGLFRAGVPRRLRLSTNLEIFWDAIEVTNRLSPAAVRTERMAAQTAELRYRGFSVVTQADRSSPELPDYNRISGTAQRWRDLVGYYTRFGDVGELLTRVDDRYVIMNAGDEILLRFAAPPQPPSGWVRDFVLIGDGWVKDGDYNTTFSKTVLPLPSHDRPDYTTAPGRLEDDPVYLRHPQDWRQYHTRYVTPRYFQDVLRPGGL